MEAASREAKAKAAAASKLGEAMLAGKAVWGSETPDDIQLDQVSLHLLSLSVIGARFGAVYSCNSPASGMRVLLLR